MILAETTPGSVRISSSARLIGRTLPAMLFKFKLCGILMRRETGGQYCRRLAVNQAKNPLWRAPVKTFTAEHDTTFRRARDACFVSPRCGFVSARQCPLLGSDRQHDVGLAGAVHPLR